MGTGQVSLEIVIFFSLEIGLLNYSGSDKSTNHFNPFAYCKVMVHLVMGFLNTVILHLAINFRRRHSWSWYGIGTKQLPAGNAEPIVRQSDLLEVRNLRVCAGLFLFDERLSFASTIVLFVLETA